MANRESGRATEAGTGVDPLLPGLPAVGFDPAVDVSPFALFQRLREGRAPILMDLRAEPGAVTLAGALPYPGPDWRPPADADVVLFDEDGGDAEGGSGEVSRARAAARRLQAAGFPRVRALYGGLALYDFALDPEVVGAERFLVPDTRSSRPVASR
jgi:hypothetical protein